MEFSRRTAWPAAMNAWSAAVSGARGSPLVDLTVSNPTEAGFTHDDALFAALGDARAKHYRPEPLGLASAREAVCRYYAARRLALDAKDVCLTASTSEAYHYCYTLLCDPGDQVLVPTPSYPLFDFLADIAAVEVVPYPLAYDGAWHVDAGGLERALARAPRAKAIVIVSPNNPTGHYLKRDEAEALGRAAQARGLALIFDEVFCDYPLGAVPGDVFWGLESEVLAFCLSGLSKICALPQLKLGWIACAGPPAARAVAMARLELIADSFLSVATPVQLALPRLFAAAAPMQRAITARTMRNDAVLRRAARGAAFSYLGCEAGFSGILRLPATQTGETVQTGEAWALALLAAGVLVQPGFFFDLGPAPYVVVSLLTREDVFAEGVDRLAKTIGA